MSASGHLPCFSLAQNKSAMVGMNKKVVNRIAVSADEIEIRINLAVGLGAIDSNPGLCNMSIHIPGRRCYILEHRMVSKACIPPTSPSFQNYLAFLADQSCLFRLLSFKLAAR